MPHLSPMNWIMALTMFWFILLILSSIMWWCQSALFRTRPKTIHSSKLMNIWKWL